MIINKKRRGYLLVEAMLASVVIAGAVLFRVQIEARYNETEKIKEFAVDVSSVPYAIDKRTLLDGHTLNLGRTTFTGAQDTLDGLLNSSLIGNTSPACSGGWNPVDALNGSLNLIQCNLFNYGKMPFDFDMDGGYSLSSNGSTSSYFVELFHATADDFDENSHVYAKLVNFMRIVDPPQITGSHKYSLINKTSKAELTPSQCFAIKQNCAIRAEYSTNLVGIGEDVYLRVNGTNFMLDSIRFKGVGMAPYDCYKPDVGGSQVVVPCGIEYTAPVGVVLGNLQMHSDSSNAENFNVVNNSLLDSSGRIMPVFCNGTGSNVACGMSVLRDPSDTNKVISRSELHEIVALRSIATNDGTQDTFSVNALTGDFQSMGNAQIDGDTLIDGSVTALTGALLKHGSNELLLDLTKTQFSGVKPTSTVDDRFAKNKNINKQLKNEIVTKGYLHSFNQIIDIGIKSSGVTHDLWRCPDGNYAKIVGFPYNSTLLISQQQIDRVCPYVEGKRLPNIGLRLDLGQNSTKIWGTVYMTTTIGCRWEGDYAQAWFMNENLGTGKYVPRFYLISPRQYGSGSVANIEVKTQFTVIQYCGQNGLL